MPRYNIDKDHVANIELPNECPFCHKSIIATYLKGNLIKYKNRTSFLEIICKCPNEQCNRLFLGYYRGNYNELYDFLGTNKGTIKEQIFSNEICEISQNFMIIYNQAFFAEQNNLLEICGVGYRKSLEFLIKDYSISRFPNKESEIKTIFLGKCIKQFVDDDRIKKVAKRAAWLGNDETHYVRKWESKDLSDLKKLISLTVHWIEMELLTESFEEEMPE